MGGGVLVSVGKGKVVVMVVCGVGSVGVLIRLV